MPSHTTGGPGHTRFGLAAHEHQFGLQDSDYGVVVERIENDRRRH
jgi:hypothetical protein